MSAIVLTEAALLRAWRAEISRGVAEFKLVLRFRRADLPTGAQDVHKG